MIRRRTRIKSRTPQRAKEVREYNAEAKAWLLLPENRFCAVAKALNKLPARSTQVHHMRGRIGRLLLDKRYWKPVSNDGHRWIHDNIEEARALGLICQRGEWHKFD